MLCTNTETIDISVQAILQQLSNNDELIVVLDNAPPHIEEKIRNINSDRITVLFSVKNGNRSSNRNLGFEHAKNGFIMFVDGDMLLEEDCINKFRAIWAEEPRACICGNVQGMQYEYGQIKFRYRDISLEEKYESSDGRNSLMHDKRLIDFRYGILDEINNNKLNWLYWYSAYCGVPAAIFKEAGQFDENLIGWGAEDVDLAYRLSQIAPIVYDTSIYALHFPHPRNIFKSRESNTFNLFRLFLKYKNADFACHFAYHNSYASIPTTRQIAEILSKDNYKVAEVNPMEAEIYVLCASAHAPDGKIIYCINGKIIELNLMGFAIPAYDQMFKRAYVSADIFAYPTQVYSMILAEACRVASDVYIKIDGNIPIPTWKSYQIDLHSLTAIQRNFYVSQTIDDFSFTKIDNRVYKVNYQIKNDIPIFSYTVYDDMQSSTSQSLAKLKQIYKANSEVIFVNLSSLPINHCPTKAISRLFDLDIVLSYTLAKKEQAYSLYTNLNDNLRNYAFNFIFFLDDIADVKDTNRWIECRLDKQDVVLDRSGNMLLLTK